MIWYFSFVTMHLSVCVCGGGGSCLLYILGVFYLAAAAAAAKSLQSYPTLCDPIDGSPPGSPVPGILQARTLEWVAISFSNAWKWKVKVKSLSRVWLLVTPWTAAYQASPSMGFSRQEYWSGVPLPSPLLPWWPPNCSGKAVLSLAVQKVMPFDIWVVSKLLFSH